MGRIRTIKPEFPLSESLGRVSRDARLTFVLLWTVADDDGRLRGNAKMLASTLYPYDDDASGLMSGWLDELAREGSIIRYDVDGSSYVQICKWKSHQRIDKPTRSTLPEPPSSKDSTTPREASSTPPGVLPESSRSPLVRNGMEWKGLESKGINTNTGPATQTPATVGEPVKRFTKPTPAQVNAYAREASLTGVDGNSFCDYYESNGWKVSSAPMKDWQAAARNWSRRSGTKQSKETAEEELARKRQEFRDRNVQVRR